MVIGSPWRLDAAVMKAVNRAIKWNGRADGKAFPIAAVVLPAGPEYRCASDRALEANHLGDPLAFIGGQALVSIIRAITSVPSIPREAIATPYMPASPQEMKILARCRGTDRPYSYNPAISRK